LQCPADHGIVTPHLTNKENSVDPAKTTPPTKTKSKSEVKREDSQKAAKEPKEKKESKPRGPRKDYGFSAGSTITVLPEDKTYRGQRLEWYNHLKAANGKTVQDFLDATKDMKDPGRGWLRFFVQDGAC